MVPRSVPDRPDPLRVVLEVGSKRVFATAVDWPGWCRSGKGEQAAVETLTSYAARYAPVADRAGFALPPLAGDDVVVVERVAGSATTDFGAPGVVAEVDHEAVDEAAGRRLAALLQATWAALDDAAAAAPVQLRKGPRGGGRDRDDIVRHVRAAERAYVRKLGLKPPVEAERDAAAYAQHQAGLLELVRAGDAGAADRSWPLRYAVRRIAWHVLDHAWEIEDKSE